MVHALLNVIIVYACHSDQRMTPNVAVAYDAMLVLTTSCDQMVASHSNVTAFNLDRRIVQQNIVGISGRINLNHSVPSTDPANKIIIVIQIDDLHFKYANFEEGTFV